MLWRVTGRGEQVWDGGQFMQSAGNMGPPASTVGRVWQPMQVKKKAPLELHSLCLSMSANCAVKDFWMVSKCLYLVLCCCYYATSWGVLLLELC